MTLDNDNIIEILIPRVLIIVFLFGVSSQIVHSLEHSGDDYSVYGYGVKGEKTCSVCAFFSSKDSFFIPVSQSSLVLTEAIAVHVLIVGYDKPVFSIKSLYKSLRAPPLV